MIRPSQVLSLSLNGSRILIVYSSNCSKKIALRQNDSGLFNELIATYLN